MALLLDYVLKTWSEYMLMGILVKSCIGSAFWSALWPTQGVSWCLLVTAVSTSHLKFQATSYWNTVSSQI